MEMQLISMGAPTLATLKLGSLVVVDQKQVKILARRSVGMGSIWT